MDDLTRPSFLSYRGAEPPRGEPPSRVYTRVDQVEQVESDASDELFRFAGGEVDLLDSVDAPWFDDAGRERGKLADADTVDEADERVSVLALAHSDLEHQLGRPPSPEREWIEVELGAPGSGSPVQHYLNLFAAPIERGLQRASWVEAPRERELADKTSMDDLPDATEDDVGALLDALAPPHAAAVYDVGQGGCNAVLDAHAPCLYFDLGGGVLANRNTFPPALTTFCFTQGPPIVLSHWDWDHWSSANRDPTAYSQTWILPRQGAHGLGAVHRTFLARILQRGTALVWPSGLQSLQRGAYRLVRCTGPPSSRNDSGLALVIEEGNRGDARRMLFPGDSAYNYVPDATTTDFTSVVCPHHGGRTRAGFVPSSDASAAGRVVYSYGQGNSYGHPLASVRSDHINAGWQHARETPSRCPARLPQAPANVLGHVHLYWDERAAEANLGCGGLACQLTCHQR